MSKYTTEVRYICENAAGYDESKGFNDVDTIIANSIDSIFSFSFPIFDENYRSVLCSKILRHYYTREIGFETVGLWKLKLQTKLLEVMPYYNQLYKSELIKFNPLYDVDLNTTHVGDKNAETQKQENRNGIMSQIGNRNETGVYNKNGDFIEGENKTGKNTSDGTSTEVDSRKNTRNESGSESGKDNKNHASSNNYSENESDINYKLYSDTPQGSLINVDNEEYLTNATKVTDGKTKTGKNNTTDIANDAYTKNNSVDATESTDGNKVGSSNVRNAFDEKNEKTGVTNENGKDTRTSADNVNRSDSNNMTGSDKFNSTESYVVHVVGKQAGASYSKMLNEFRETFLNIDMDIINSMSDLFMNLW